MNGYRRLADSDIELVRFETAPRSLEDAADMDEDPCDVHFMPADSDSGMHETASCSKTLEVVNSVFYRWFPLLAYLGVTIVAVVVLRYMFDGTACTDTVDWDNGHGLGCKMYSKLRYCESGLVRSSRVSGPAFGDPKRNCCVCGKRVPNASATAMSANSSGAAAGVISHS
jgi:hypothetical protein